MVRLRECNTAKYLMSATPDGLIDYISKGSCGRCTDISITEKYGYINVIPVRIEALPDRGIKQLDI